MNNTEEKGFYIKAKYGTRIFVQLIIPDTAIILQGGRF